MTTEVCYCKNTTYLVLCFVQSLPWLFNRALLTDTKIKLKPRKYAKNFESTIEATLTKKLKRFLIKMQIIFKVTITSD